MQNIFALAYSIAYILLILGLATLIARFSQGASETSRKFVHIMVGNWVFISLFFTDLWAVVLVPFSFIIINSLSLKYNLISAMERKDDSLGTVYYAISMFVLSAAGFMTGWKLLPLIGLLTMAYGDGFAAITGQRWGITKPFSFAPNKSLVGSVTVAFASFLVTLFSILAFPKSPLLQITDVLMIVFIALLTGLFSAFIELTGQRGSDNLILPIGSGLFATLSYYFGNPGYYLYLLLAGVILIVAYRKRSITPDGIVAAILTAVTLYAFGGVWVSASLLVFFILGSVVSKLNNEQKRKAEALQEDTGPRSWKQVLSNSLPPTLLVIVAHFFPNQEYLILLALGVFSAAASDTFSSELGMLSQGKVFHILTGKPIERGLSGGVSWFGLAAGLLGSVLLSLLAIPQFGLWGFTVATMTGFMGSIVDSVLGALLQRKYVGSHGGLQDRPTHSQDKPVSGFSFITNGAVNFISLSIVLLVGIIFIA